jgi:hypothetical protein
VVSETCADEVIAKFSQSPEHPMAIPPGEVVRLAVRHMHPLSATAFRGAIHSRPDTCLLFRVPGEGLVARSAYTWLFIDPQRIPITAAGEPITSDADPRSLVHIVSDSDDMLFLSLAPLDKELEVFLVNHANEPVDIARMTLHPSLQVSPFYDIFDTVCSRLHYGTMNEQLWQPVVRRSEIVFRRVRMMRTLMRIWKLLKGEGCRHAARLISLALFSLKLPDNWLIDAPMTIFVPNDQAIDALPPDDFRRLLDRRTRREVLRAMLAHAVMGSEPLFVEAGAEHKTMLGNGVWLRAVADELLVNETCKVLRDLRCGPHRVCIIDRVLEFQTSPAIA